jgi:hypothetical protein
MNNRAAEVEALMLAVREEMDYRPGVTEVGTAAAQQLQLQLQLFSLPASQGQAFWRVWWQPGWRQGRE